MEEYVSEAIVLRKESLRDVDRRYFLFTEKFGKMVGKAVSARKITSKLAPHLEPGYIVKVRFIEKNGPVIVDSLKTGKLQIPDRANFINDLKILSDILPESQPEPELWELLIQRSFSWSEILKILGWDPEGAVCANCGRGDASYFYLPRQEFFCRSCALKARPSEVLLIASSDAKI